MRSNLHSKEEIVENSRRETHLRSQTITCLSLSGISYFTRIGFLIETERIQRRGSAHRIYSRVSNKFTKAAKACVFPVETVFQFCFAFYTFVFPPPLGISGFHGGIYIIYRRSVPNTKMSAARKTMSSWMNLQFSSARHGTATLRCKM